MFRSAAILFGVVWAAVTASGSETDPRYLEGYVTAVIERDLGLVVSEVLVNRGRARVVVEDLEGLSAERVAEAVARVHGIEEVVVRVVGAETDPTAQAEVVEPEAGGEADGLEVLPRHELFEPLLADPREPHFFAVYQGYLADNELGHVGSANLGETFALLGGVVGGSRWELGLLGGVFSIFDLEAPSTDLVNSDFLVGPTLSLRRGALSTQLRVYHQSSHLGDEFLLRTRTNRVNLSYEGMHLVGSAQLHTAVRVYLGGGAIFHSEPDLQPLSFQAGIELRSPVAFLGDLVRPIAAFDLQVQEENHWHEELGGVAGVEFSNPNVLGMRLMLLASYFRGNSPNGQFFGRRIEYLGIGAHLFF